MKIKCQTCGSVVEDIAGVCPVCGMIFRQQTDVPPVDSVNMDAGMGNMGNQMPPYNYQSPVPPVAAKQPKKKLLSILSIVFAVVGIFAMCVPGLSLLCCVTAIVLGIIALVKKQIKVPAILGLVFGGIGSLVAVLLLMMDLMLNSVTGTGMLGIFQQSIDAATEGYTKLSDVSMELPVDGKTVTLTLTSDLTLSGDGSYYASDTLGSGYYRESGYMDLSSDTELTNCIVYAMSQGFEIKNLTIVDLQPTDESGYGKGSRYIFIVPEGYTPGSIVYYIDLTDATSYEDMKLDVIMTMPVE